MRTRRLIVVLLALVVASAASAQEYYFESNWNAWPTFNPQWCETNAGFNIDWDPDIGVWAIKFSIAVQAPATEVSGLHFYACDGGLPDGWTESVYYNYVNGKVVRIDYYARAPFDMETGKYYKLLWPYGKSLVYTDACLEDNGGWCIVAAPYQAIEIGGYDSGGHVVASTSTSTPGVVLENPCAATEGCGGLKPGQTYSLPKPAPDGPTVWGAVKGLYR